MASKWSELFLHENGKRKASPLLLGFIAFQVLILIVVIANITTINKGEVDDDAARYKKMPELTVKDLSNKISSLKESEVADIQKKIFKIVSENTSNISTNEIEATIRNEDFYEHSFSESTKYVNMIIDIPSLGQTYEVIYSTNAVLDPGVMTFVLCPDKAKMINQNFDCKSSDKDIRSEIVPAYLGYFKYEYFTPRINPEKPNTIIISPSVTYDNDEDTKNEYIDEVKASIKSLGISPDAYDYYVRTAKDVNYRN